MVVTSPLRSLVLIVAFLLLFTRLGGAATYYIDYASGNDGNSGTSKSSPWKLCPGMAGAAQHYSHSAGDHFIFKGGVTWPVSCFPMTIASGGSSDSVRDSYGVDQTWFATSSWSRPIFDFQQTNLGAAVRVNAPWVQFDNVEMKNLKIPSNSQAGAYGAASITFNFSNGGNSKGYVTNCYIHDWMQDNTNGVISSGQDAAGGGGVFGSSCTVDVINCKFDQALTPVKCGAACRNIFGVVSGSEFSNTTQGVLGGATIHDCIFHDFSAPSDPAAHCNAIETFNITTVYNCTFYNLDGHTAPILINPDAIHQQGTSRVYNCVMWNTGVQTPICLDSQNYDTTAMAGEYLEVYNCTISGNATPIRFGYRGSAPFGGITVKNCLFITTASPAVGYNSQVLGFGNVISHAESNNLILTPTQATAAGYTAGNTFQPTGASSPTVNTGTTISLFAFDRMNRARPQGGAWDVGAYEFGGTPAGIPTPTPAPSSSPSPTPPPGASPSPTVAGLAFNAADGVISSPFVATGGGISQGLQTVDPALGGRAVYNVAIPTAGDYGIVANVICGGDANNSFFINIDAEPTAPDMIWDVAQTSGLEQRIVSWRGTGTDTSNEFAPKIFHLSQGMHQLILRGRESGAEIDRITFVKAPAPPSNLVVAP